MSNRLVQSYKGVMRLSGHDLIAYMEEEDSRDLVPVRWSLKRKCQTNMSTVFIATHGWDKRVVKRIPSSKLSRNELQALIELKDSSYNHLFVRFDRWFEQADQIYCMMEYVSLGDLKKFRETFTPSEQWIRLVTIQITQALSCMHDLGYAHRDIKPGNVLIANLDPPRIKICDFGISTWTDQRTTFTNDGFMSSPYAAPEALSLDTSRRNDQISTKVDMWALGCLIVELVLGYVQFPTTNRTELFCRDIDLQTQLWKELKTYMTPDGVLAVQYLLRVNPADRPAAADLLSQAWMRQNLPTSTRTAICLSENGSKSAGLSRHPSTISNDLFSAEFYNTTADAIHRDQGGAVGDNLQVKAVTSVHAQRSSSSHATSEWRSAHYSQSFTKDDYDFFHKHAPDIRNASVDRNPKFWKSVARMRPTRRSSEEWQQYYEKIVMPVWEKEYYKGNPRSTPLRPSNLVGAIDDRILYYQNAGDGTDEEHVGPSITCLPGKSWTPFLSRVRALAKEYQDDIIESPWSHCGTCKVQMLTKPWTRLGSNHTRLCTSCSQLQLLYAGDVKELAILTEQCTEERVERLARIMMGIRQPTNVDGPIWGFGGHESPDYRQRCLNSQWQVQMRDLHMIAPGKWCFPR